MDKSVFLLNFHNSFSAKQAKVILNRIDCESVLYYDVKHGFQGCGSKISKKLPFKKLYFLDILNEITDRPLSISEERFLIGKKDVINLVFNRHQFIFSGQSININWTNNILRKFSKFSKFSEEYNFEVSKLLFIWARDLIVKHNILYYINAVVPHLHFDYMIYLTCEFLNIPRIVFQKTNVVGLSYLLDLQKREFICNPTLKIEKEFQELISELVKTEVSRIQNNDLPVYMENKQNEFELDREVDENVQYVKTVKKNRILKLKNKLSLKRYHQIVSKTKKHVDVFDVVTLNLVEIEALKINGRKVVFFPLHMQPEATSIPLGAEFGNQVKIFEYLLNTIPNDVIVVLKHHPNQKENWYKNLWKPVDNYKNVFWTSEKSSAILKYVDFVVSITGTVMTEALLNGIPIISFGTTIFKDNYYCFSVVGNDESFRNDFLSFLEKNFDKSKVKEDAISNMMHCAEFTYPILDNAYMHEMASDELKAFCVKRMEKLGEYINMEINE